MKTTFIYLAHYFRGANAAAWNGGWTAVAAAIGQAGAVVAGAKIPLPTPTQIWWTWAGAAFVAAVLYFREYPLPVIAPSTPDSPPPAARTPAAAAPSPATMATALGLLLCLGLTGCSSSLPSVPPFAFGTWTHEGNYGPFQTRVSATGASKTADGRLVVNHYEGKAGWLGFGPHDIIENLTVDLPRSAPPPAAAPIPATQIVPVATVAK